MINDDFFHSPLSVLKIYFKADNFFYSFSMKVIYEIPQKNDCILKLLKVKRLLYNIENYEQSFALFIVFYEQLNHLFPIIIF